MAEACAGADARRCRASFPGSWIDANFYIWIGHADDQRAWSQLARRAAGARRRAGAGAAGARWRGAARRCSSPKAATGSGGTATTIRRTHDLEFDDLFRRHLRNVYRLLEQAGAGRALRQQHLDRPARRRPQTDADGAAVTPTLDGEETSYFEWLGAGHARGPRGRPARCTRRDRRPALVTLVQFGFDRERLFVRVDASSAPIDLLADGREMLAEVPRARPASGSRSARRSDG